MLLRRGAEGELRWRHLYAVFSTNNSKPFVKVQRNTSHIGIYKTRHIVLVDRNLQSHLWIYVKSLYFSSIFTIRGYISNLLHAPDTAVWLG